MLLKIYFRKKSSNWNAVCFKMTAEFSFLKFFQNKILRFIVTICITSCQKWKIENHHNLPQFNTVYHSFTTIYHSFSCFSITNTIYAVILLKITVFYWLHLLQRITWHYMRITWGLHGWNKQYPVKSMFIYRQIISIYGKGCPSSIP